MFSTQDPPTIQQMPWPAVEDEDEVARPAVSYDTWLLNELDFTWLVEPDGELDFNYAV